MKVVTPFGEIAWNDLSRISDEEMKAFNVEVNNRIYTYLQALFNPKYASSFIIYLMVSDTSPTFKAFDEGSRIHFLNLNIYNFKRGSVTSSFFIP